MTEASTPDLPRQTVLIIDDIPINLTVLAESLEARGFRVAIAQDGSEGLQRAEFLQPGLILLDVMLPGLDGFEVCRRLKANACTRDIPVIFMTALSECEDRVRGFAVGGVDFVIKPLQMDEVVARVDTHLKLYASQRLAAAQNAQLQQYRESLERLVTERTADLHESNRQLREEIGERKCMGELLSRREYELRTLVENLPDPIFRYDRDCRRTYASPEVERITGKTFDELVGQTPYGMPLATGSENDQLMRNIHHVLETGQPIVGEVEYLAPDGRLLHFQNHFGPELAADGSVAGVLSIMRDITEFRRLEELLHTREREFRTLVENSPDTIARYDRECRRVYANPKLVTNMGGDISLVLGTTASAFPGGPAALAYQEKIQEVFDRGEKRNFELRWQTGNVEFCSDICLAPEFNRSGDVVHVLAVGRDITEIDQYRKKIHQQAFFDSLTGLPNRLLLSDRISQTIADAAHHGRKFGLMLLDLDNFKEVNDALGHSVGDRLLCEAANRMKQSVRADDTVARLGGDEFAMLLPDVREDDDPAMIAGKILHQLAEPFTIDGRDLFVTGSIGIALYPGDSVEINALYKYADSAMYHAKKMGRNNFQFYAKEFTVRSLERMEVEAALRKAQKNGELVLYYQPQVELHSGRVVGAEALLRWCRPGHGMVAPDGFISIAEESGLIVDIGEWALRTACETVAGWNRERKAPVTLAVNLSTRQFTRNDLVGFVRRVLAETGCKPEWLELEITESLLLEDSIEMAAMLAALHDMGLSISIDDFGTGYSALSYLNRFPVSQIKIDRSFVNDIPEQPDKCALVKAMISIAAALRLETVAEGVETSEQAEYLMAHGCQLAQGYLFGKPMLPGEFEAVLAREDQA